MFKLTAVTPAFLWPFHMVCIICRKIEEQLLYSISLFQTIKNRKIIRQILVYPYITVGFVWTLFFLRSPVLQYCRDHREYYKKSPRNLIVSFFKSLYLMTALLYSLLCQACDEGRVYFFSLYKTVKSLEFRSIISSFLKRGDEMSKSAGTWKMGSEV